MKCHLQIADFNYFAVCLHVNLEFALSLSIKDGVCLSYVTFALILQCVSKTIENNKF